MSALIARLRSGLERFRVPLGSAGVGEALPQDSRSSRSAWAAALVGAAAGALLATGFLPRQSVWVDEASQLGGLSLGPLEMLRWLCGKDFDRFGVLGDTAPPLSYLAGMLWASLFGMSEASIRWMGVFITGVSTIVLTRAAWRIGGAPGAWACALIAGLSPNLILTGLEIRSYSHFALWASCSFYALIRYLMDDRGRPLRWLAAMALFLTLAIFSHFFGIVLAASVLSVCFLFSWIHRRPLRPVLLFGGATVLASFGILPFVLFSFRYTGGVAEDPARLVDVVRFAYRIAGHMTLATSPVMNGLAIGSAGVLLLISSIVRGPARPACRALLAVLGAGFVFTGVISQLSRSLGAFSPRYSIWMAPCFALLCAGALRVEVRRARLAGAVCAALLLAGYAYADWRLESSGNLFAHNPHHRISEFVAKDPSDLIVFHEEWDYGQTYFPLVHTFGMELRQYRPVEGGQLRVVRIRNRDADAPVELSELKASRFLVLRGRWLTQEDARRELQGKAVPMEPGRVTNALLKQPGWRRVAWEHLPAVWLGRIDVFER